MLKNEKEYFRLFTVSTLICLLTVILFVNSGTGEDYIKVSTVFNDENDSDVSADIDGYLNGKWNLWEYIGDFFSGLIE